jgi:type I restriction enzyme S subunit
VTSNWPIVTLGEISSLITRGISPVYVEQGGCAVINQRCIRDDQVNQDPIRRHDVMAKAIPDKKKLIPGDLLINSTGVGTVGRVAVFSDNFNERTVTVDSHVTIVRGIKTQVTSDYLKYSLINFSEELISKAQGSGGQIELTRASIEALKIPLPPLDEQKRIVAKLDEALGDLHLVTENSKRTLDQIDELWVASIDEVMSEIASVAPVSTVGDIFKTSSGGTPLKSRKDYYEGGSVPWLLSGEVANSEITSAKNFITELALKETSAKLAPSNSVLVAMYGATAGEVGILRFEASTNQAVCAIHPIDGWNTDFIYFWMVHSKKHLVSMAAGNAQPNVSQIKIRSLPIPLLEQSSQENVVSRLSEIRKFQEETYLLKKKSISEQVSLRGSVLSAAFSGDF